MTLLNNYEELSFLVMKHLKKGVFTNFFMTKEEAIEYINQQMFYYYSEDDFLVFAREYDNRYVINFYLNNFYNADNFWSYLKTLPKKVVIEVPYNFSNKDTITEFESFLTEHGFSKIMDRVKLLKESDGRINTKLKIKQDIHLVSLAESLEVNKIFTDSFDEFYGCIPTVKTLEKDIENGNILGIYKDDTLAGILRFSKSSKEISIKHLAIKLKYRGKDFGKMLVNYLTKMYQDSRITTWVNADNDVAYHVYAGNGIQIDKYRSIVYIL